MPVTRARASRRRSGHSLVELLVALPLAALLGTVAVALLLDTHRLARRLNSTTELSRELRQAGEVLTAEIRPLAAPDIISWSDSAIEFHALIGSGVVCALPSPTELDLLPLAGTDALRTAWFATPQTEDNVWTVLADSALVPGPQQWRMSSLASTSSAAASGCNTQPLFTLGSSAGPAQRITLQSALPRAPETGTLVRITRHVRYSLYRASDGLWYLGRKSLDSSGWTTVQPVAGPLLSAARNGLRMQVLDSASNAIVFGNARTPHSVALAMRSESRWLRSAASAGVSDSLLLTVALRGQAPATVP